MGCGVHNRVALARHRHQQPHLNCCDSNRCHAVAAISIFQDASTQAAKSSLMLIAFWLCYLTIALSSSPSLSSRVSTSCGCSDHNHKMRCACKMEMFVKWSRHRSFRKMKTCGTRSSALILPPEISAVLWPQPRPSHRKASGLVFHQWNTLWHHVLLTKP